MKLTITDILKFRKVIWAEYIGPDEEYNEYLKVIYSDGAKVKYLSMVGESWVKLPFMEPTSPFTDNQLDRLRLYCNEYDGKYPSAHLRGKKHE